MGRRPGGQSERPGLEVGCRRLYSSKAGGHCSWLKEWVCGWVWSFCMEGFLKWVCGPWLWQQSGGWGEPGGGSPLSHHFPKSGRSPVRRHNNGNHLDEIRVPDTASLCGAVVWAQAWQQKFLMHLNSASDFTAFLSSSGKWEQSQYLSGQL